MSRRLPALLAVLLLLPVAGDALAQDPGSAPAGPVRVRFETTKGPFTVELDAGRAPLSVANFLQYVRDGHYDGTIFHRVIGNFIVQGGGFLPTGTEKPTRPALANESGNGLSNRRGTVAMARTEQPHSATSQFYVNLADNLVLDPGPTRWGYAVIGRVVEGMDVIDRIASLATGRQGPFPEDAPLEPVLIESAKVVASGLAAAPGT
ncbi:MAG TPA: peptidylprolyl isomerase [Steroidobacteraceae bacterium]|nr:peptidylprolyl isomerase [Steroidobacteraceae bacterium]